MGVAQLEARGESVPRDAFGHVKLDKVQPGAYFAKQFAEKLGAEKVLVQKSGYMARAAPANVADRAVINACATFGRMWHQGQLRVYRPGRGARRLAAGHRVPAHQGRQGLRRPRRLVPGPAAPGELRLIVFSPPTPASQE